MHAFYILDEENNVVETEDFLEHARFFEDLTRRVVGHTVTEYYEVSTVFLGIRHNPWHDGPPVLFETMIFTREPYDALISAELSFDQACHRYTSWDDAETGHKTFAKRMAKQIEFALADKIEDQREAEKSAPSR